LILGMNDTGAHGKKPDVGVPGTSVRHWVTYKLADAAAYFTGEHRWASHSINGHYGPMNIRCSVLRTWRKPDRL
jgi:hypothetical protein